MVRRDPLAKRLRRRGPGRYLLDGEQIVTAAHHHWARVALPVLSVVAGLVVVLVLDSILPASLGLLANLLWWAWFVLVGWAMWKVLEWRHDWFVATDKRLILTYGLITRKVAMMPLVKVTDMSYNRSPTGRLFGYGTFVMESAGQDQALHKVRWVADPDHTYRAICAEIFGVQDRERVLDQDGSPNEPDLPKSTNHQGGTHQTGTPQAGTHQTGTHQTGTPRTGTHQTGTHDADTGPISY